MDGISDHKILDLNCSYDSRQLFCVLVEMQISWARCHEGKILFIAFVFQYGVEIIINFPEKAQHDQESSKKTKVSLAYLIATPFREWLGSSTSLLNTFERGSHV